MVAGRGLAAGTLWGMSSSVITMVATAEEHTRELPMSPYGYGAIAFVAFLVALGVLWFFRGAAQKIAAGHGPHGSEYQGEGQAARAAQADQHGGHH
jgi:drug/metabolite transporter (DMT)-like permease